MKLIFVLDCFLGCARKIIQQKFNLALGLHFGKKSILRIVCTTYFFTAPQVFQDFGHQSTSLIGRSVLCIYRGMVGILKSLD